MTASFSRAATVTASTKRDGGTTADGLEVGYVENIASLSCLPLDPVNPELTLGVTGLAWHETLQTMTEGDLDITEKDLFVVGGTEYPIQAIEEWTNQGSEFKRIYLQDIK